MSETPSDSPKLLLESRRIACKQRLSKHEKIFAASIYIGAAFFLFGSFWILGLALGLLVITRQHAIFYAQLPLMALVLWTLLPFMRASVRRAEEDLRNVEFELDLLRFDATPRESRAEKLLRINQYQLKLYYDQNLSQGSWIFALGVVSIFVGVGLIVLTLYLVKSLGQNWQDKAVVGLVGALGSILTNYVAAIYLKMHSEVAKSLVAFHSKLVGTHQLFLANLLAALITDDAKRFETLSKLAVAISPGAKDSPDTVATPTPLKV